MNRTSLWKIINYTQQSMLLPTKIRMALLRFSGLKIHSSASISSGVFIGSTNLAISENSFININTFLDGNAPIAIGSHVQIGPYVKILTGTHSIAKNKFRRGPGSVDINLPVTIKDGVWIGIGATILPGVTIEEGCVIGANSLVTNSTKANGLYLGSPAQRIKNLPL